MSHPTASNGGFRPQDLSRRTFQVSAAVAIDKQAVAIGQTREFMADMSTRVDDVSRRVGHLDHWQATFDAQTFWQRLRWLVRGQ